MGHRILRSLGSSRSAHHIVDIAELAEHVLHAVVDSIDFVEGGVRRHHCLQQERSLVELRHEVRADEEGQGNSWYGDRDGGHLHQSGMAHRSIESWRIQPFEPPDQPDILFSAWGRGAKKDGGGDRNQRQRKNQRGGERGDDGRRERPIHAPLDAGHRKQRYEDGHDNERREQNRAAHLLRGVQRDLMPRHAGTLLQMMDDVFGDDNRRIDQKTHGNGEPAQRHGVDADAPGAQQQSGERDGQREREGHQQRGAPVPEEDEQDDHNEARSDQNRATDAAKGAVDQIRLVVDHPQRHTFRQRRTNVVERLANGQRHGDGVRSELLHDAAADDLSGKSVRHATTHRRRFDDVGNIAQRDRYALFHGHDRGSQLVDRLNATHRAYRPLGAALRDEAPRAVDVGVFDGMQHFVNRHVTRRHARRVDLHLELAEVSAKPFDCGNARHGE